VPRGVQEAALKVKAAEREMSAKTGQPPTPHELAQYMELPLEEVVEGLYAAAAHHATSIDAPLDDSSDGGGTLADTYGMDDERFEHIEAALTIAGSLRGLTKLERRVLSLYFLEEMTQAQIGKQVGVSQMQVSRILRRATERLREMTAPEGDLR
jgi:RNA polymerase sigma-B factor